MGKERKSRSGTENDMGKGKIMKRELRERGKRQRKEKGMISKSGHS